MDLELPPDFKEFLRLLNAQGVEYLLIGGYAVGYYGYPRATNDLDIWIAVQSENAERMVTALRDFGFETPELSASLFLQDENIVEPVLAGRKHRPDGRTSDADRDYHRHFGRTF